MTNVRQIQPYCDRERRTCIQVRRAAGVVRYISLDVEKGLEVREESAKEFDDRYQPMADYPPARAAALFVGYSRVIGASEEALGFLGAVVKISQGEVAMAVAKTSERVALAAKAAEKKTPAVKAAKAPAKKASGKAPTGAAKAVKPLAEGKLRETAAAMFRELLLGGALTDDQIFEEVKKKFGLDDSKRSYVAWHRASLRKAGVAVPEKRV
jgi:hypothetical protein